jgi:DNA-binding NarL/FixJ family response regulator
MGKTKKVIVVSSAFLLSAGIENLALELSGMLVDHVYIGSEKNLCEKIISKKPEYVVIDPESINDGLLPLLRKLNQEKQIKIIGLISSNSKNNIISLFRHTLNIQHTKYKLVETLKKIIGKEDKVNNQDEKLLSKRETEILRNLALGLTNQEIADKLFLSIHTVMTHRKKITRKLAIKTVSGLTVYALMNKLVDMREVERSE